MFNIKYKGTVDSHFHILEMKRKEIDIDLFIDNWKKSFDGYLIDIGITEDDIEERLNLSASYNKIFHTVGIHPNDCHGDLNSRIKVLENHLNSKKIVGIGETGLDFYWDKVDKSVQIEFFKAHIDLALKYNLPIIIHDREASLEIVKVLLSYNRKFRGIIHCFSSNEEYLNIYLDLGFHISYAGNVTYKKNIDLQNTVNKVPLAKLLLETDSPYLSPVPKRGKLNSPLNLEHTYSYVANKLEIETEVLIAKVNRNLKELFKLEELND